MDREIRDSVKAAYLEYEEEPMAHYYSHWLVGYPSRLRVKKLLRELGNIKGKTVLDVGCEDGYVSVKMARLGAKVIAFDVVKPSIEKLRKKIRKHGLSIKAFVAFAQKIPLKKGSIDAIVCTEVIEHMPKREIAFAEFARVLRPGGIVVITFPNEGLRKKLYPIVRLFGINSDVEEHVTLFEYSAGQIKAMLRKHFTIVRSYRFPRFLPLTNMIVCRKPQKY